MDNEKTIERWRYDRRCSLGALKVQTPLSIVAIAVSWALSHVHLLFAWIMYVVIAVGAFGFIGDVVNVLYLTHKLKQSTGH